MKRIGLVFALIGMVGCSKIVTKDGNRFFQENPAPNPTESPGSGACDPGHLGDLLDYALYVTGDLRLDHVNVAKRVAANYACVQHGEIGGGLAANANRVDLASAGQLGVNGMKIAHGKVTFGSTLERVRSTALGGFAKGPTDLHANLRTILDFAKGCASAPTNAGITRTCRHGSAEVCTIRITGENPGVNIAELSPLQIANVTTYVIDVPKGSTLVTNLPLNTVAIFRNVEVTFAARSAPTPGSGNLFWNFPVADGLEFTGTKFRGIVVAPDAAVKVACQDGEGGFWVRELSGTESRW